MRPPRLPLPPHRSPPPCHPTRRMPPPAHSTPFEAKFEICAEVHHPERTPPLMRDAKSAKGRAAKFHRWVLADRMTWSGLKTPGGNLHWRWHSLRHSAGNEFAWHGRLQKSL